LGSPWGDWICYSQLTVPDRSPFFDSLGGFLRGDSSGFSFFSSVHPFFGSRSSAVAHSFSSAEVPVSTLKVNLASLFFFLFVRVPVRRKRVAPLVEPECPFVLTYLFLLALFFFFFVVHTPPPPPPRLGFFRLLCACSFVFILSSPPCCYFLSFGDRPFFFFFFLIFVGEFFDRPALPPPFCPLTSIFFGDSPPLRDLSDFLPFFFCNNVGPFPLRNTRVSSGVRAVMSFYALFFSTTPVFPPPHASCCSLPIFFPGFFPSPLPLNFQTVFGHFFSYVRIFPLCNKVSSAFFSSPPGFLG